ncbi:D-2-hydroxyacid dehydrogenase [Bacillus methanolicus]|uniref:D-isomer specific 2-hydroxyacid dehydrogenase NAD-binding protein n=1 Tax=Bacillus methanolicus (strain MGA3 / ATCC 53907) TaxID=796606 RepID=I3E322_BACMM|nr:D-2-hydroxyacid dehydrogenase [Bacillus methanolicus]AIE59014.1 D-isomer specific 2-hydroxyacid dehydrogenase NAD-binding protein [Bacillus methanolicus MGA3]EIJ80893.1 dehydrogenase [Bacillus methanolicus MGA3]
MQKRKLVITHNLDECLTQKIKETVTEWDVVIGKDRTIWQNHLKDAEIIAGWKKEMEESIEINSNLRWLQSWSAGVDDLPLEKLAERKILLTSANGVHAYPISETILALMLALTRKIHTYIKNQQSKTWHHSGLKLEMHQKTVGIIGVGAIGKETAKIAKAFGMTVLGVRRSGRPEEFVDEMFTTDHLNSILPKCDYVVVTLPLTKDTRHLFGKEQFVLMKPSAFFINIGRGEVVNEAELIQALQDGQIAGAGLDVFETEPLGENSPLWDMENVIITPHTAGSTEHYNKRVIEDIFIPNLKNYLEGKTPTINLVDYEKGY